ncbi:ribosomal protection-like ABC-F family protein [Streptococcus marmotae]|uniref:ribosomal protection-like ABC-F family protein n=1 Tax=Streptococcus marmotae TaxID=1825069 RepID=UPI00082CCB24|nr:ABC-F family ATP-binding cassette domain-containing protein [Streptococcus marmotae]
MEVITCINLKKEVEGRELVTIPHLNVQSGQRIGLIGENGIGKSSLLNIFIGADEEYSGQVWIRSDWAYVPQLKEASSLSGGEQTLKAIKKALSQRAGILFLDEPTASMDQENRQWLIHQLRRYKGTVIVVSHDRYFLNQVVDHIWLLAEQTITSYVGNYQAFEEARKKDREQQEQAYQHYQQTVNHLGDVVQTRKQRADKLTKRKKGRSSSEWKVQSQMGSYDSQAKAMAKGAKAIEKRIERLETIKQPRKEAWAKLEMRGVIEQDIHTLFRLAAGQVRIDGQRLFDYPSFSMQKGNRLALTGRNGSGKTTFIRQLMRKELAGYFSEKLAIAYFAQDLQDLDETQSAFENAASCSVQDRVTILNLLAMLGIRYEKARQKVAVLSGGERVRLSLAKTLLSDHHLLILDEPTNFLDLTTILALEQFLKDYKGSLIVISHDPAFVANVTNQTWNIENGVLKQVSHGYRLD